MIRDRFDIHKEMQEVYIHSFFNKLGMSLVTIFIPLYLLSSDFTIMQVGLFFASYSLIHLVISIPFYHISGKVGYKKTALLSSPLLIGYYILLRSVTTAPEIYGVAAVGGAGMSLYWAGMNPEVARSSHENKRDEETGLFFSIPTIASIISPALGGLILSFYSYDALFVATGAILGISFIPFIFTEEHHDGLDTDFRSFLNMDFLDDFLTFFFDGASSIGKKMVWPLYLAIVISGSVDIGIAGSFLALGSAFTSLMIGKITEDGNRKQIVMSGVLVTCLTYIAFAQITSPLIATGLSFINGLGRTAISLSAYSKAMSNAEREDYLEYFAFREISLNLGRLTALAGVLLIFTISGSFVYSFSAIIGSVILFGVFLNRMA